MLLNELLRLGIVFARKAFEKQKIPSAGIEEHEMRRAFNAGVGFVVIVPPAEEIRATEVLRGLGETPIALGTIVRVESDRPFEDRVEWPS